MFRSFFASKKYIWKAYGRAGWLIGLTCLNVWLNIEIVRVIGGACKILENPSLYEMRDFWEQFVWYLLYRAGFVLSDPWMHYQSKLFAIDWRQALTEIFILRWENILGRTKLRGVSQRLQEEPYAFSRFFDSMGLQLLHSTLAAIGFGLELSKISPTSFHFHFAPWEALPSIDFRIGTMLVIAFSMFAVGLVAAVFLGWKIPRAESYNRDKEADFRDLLVLTEDEKMRYDKKALYASFQLVHESYVWYFKKVIPLDAWKSLYWNANASIPWIIGAHWIFAGEITLGELLPIIGNFEQCMGGLSLFINNWRGIVDFVATRNRLMDFTNAISCRRRRRKFTARAPYERFLKSEDTRRNHQGPGT